MLAILELRISLEVESAGLAAQRRNAEQLALMRDALDALNESAAHDDQQHYMNRLSREHEEIYEAIARQDSEAARAACVYI